MSTGRHDAKRAKRRAREAENQSHMQQEELELKAKKEREKSQKLFIRQMMARQGGGFFDQVGNSGSQTLG